jgi:hypothetical protein
VLLVVMSFVPFLALELFFYVKAKKGLGPRRRAGDSGS